MKLKLSSPQVGIKINEWYRQICGFHVMKAEKLKAEIEQEILEMEQDQNLLLFYQLMDFRHKVMLEYFEPAKKASNDEEIKKLLETIEHSQTKLTDMLEYYVHFFTGMFEFEQRNYLSAIAYYRSAEKKLNLISDDIERAEFYFKLAEIYYHMKQTHFSMHYALQALDTYSAYRTYTLRIIHCEFVIGANYDDLKCYEHALPYFKNALKRARSIGNPRVIGSALFNLGNCYYQMNNLATASRYLKDSLEVFEKENLTHLNRSLDPLFMLTQILFKQKQIEESLTLYQQGIMKACELEDEIYICKFQFLKALYVDAEIKIIDDTLDLLEDKRLYPDIEELALDAAHYYNELGLFEVSTRYYERKIQAISKIQNGGHLYENEFDSSFIGSNCRVIGHESAAIGREPYGAGGQTPYNSGDYRIS
ncbi:Rap family tetratricopeptide repeat protein [Bacillus altitudinis]|uniref:Rap family tetratricopeptide repeat protein n=1 Tax=Bacillus altitudinis TaxID=293387 RepID=UPI002409AF5E|nr:Rap family tetratricopeptide repeat protein [Bacillus altitudinis]WEZ71955.1 tetratricopeptide repeat protein [Bacillus altitudinis]